MLWLKLNFTQSSFAKSAFYNYEKIKKVVFETLGYWSVYSK